MAKSIQNSNVLSLISNSILDKIIYIGIFALFIIPFLIPYSYFPVTKFYAEVLTLIIAGFIGLISIYRAERIYISNVGIATLLFGIFLLLQIFLVNIRFPGINIVIALEFFVATLMSIGITSIIGNNEDKQKQLIQGIAWAILISVTIQSIYAVLQFTGTAANYPDFILYSDIAGSNIIGNIGQKNDFSDFLAIGIFALSYLYFIRQIKLSVYIAYALFFGFVITINTSRTTFLYFIFAILATLLFVVCNRKNSEFKMLNRRVSLLLGGLFIGLIIVEALVPKIIDMFSAHPVVTSGLERFNANSVGQSTYRRFYEWYKDLVLFVQHPIFGIGWYQYPKAAIDIMMTPRFMYIPANQALYTHSHNSPLNILAETGIVGFMITMVYGFGYSLYKMFKNFNNHATLFIGFMVLTIFAQSLLQYPLWYSYFLMFFVLFLSLNKASIVVNNSKAIKVFVTILFIAFVWFCGINSTIFNKLVGYTRMSQDADDYAQNVQQLKDLVDNNVIWALPAVTVLDAYNNPTTTLTNSVMSVKEQQKYIDMLANEMPYPSGIFKQIIIHKLNGDKVGALYYANLLAHGYPFFKDNFAKQLQSSSEFNDDVSAIYNFKYEDRSPFSRLLKKKVGQ